MNPRRVASPRGARTSGFLADRGGAAAAEIALWLTVLTLPALTVVDIGTYVYSTMQVQAAAHHAADAARKACGWNAVPLTSSSNCNQTTLTSAIAAAAQSTSLGSNVAVSSGYPQEQYYCVDATGALTAVGTAGTSGSPPTPPADCSGVTKTSTAAAGDYLKVQVTYTYAPMFNGITLSAGLPSPITATAWLKMQ